MLQTVKGLTSSWEGEASTAYTTKFNQLESDMTKYKGMINEHVKDLEEMANTYERAEQQNESDSQGLPSNVMS